MLDKLEMLLCLAAERHFGRAALAAGVTQPTLSSAVKTLEEQFGVLIVARGARFQGFTPEGERILHWARRLVADARSMRQEIRAASEGLSGQLRLAVVPTALPFVAELTVPLCRRHARLGFTILSMPADQILTAVEQFSVDAGIAYVQGPMPARLMAIPLYEERHCLLLDETLLAAHLAERRGAVGGVVPGGWGAARAMAPPAFVSWAQVARLPLCLLSSDMRYRRLVDARLATVGGAVVPRVETNALTVLETHVASGLFATLLPVRHARALAAHLAGPRADGGRLVAIPLEEDGPGHQIGLVVPRRDPLPNAVAALAEAARRWPATGIEARGGAPVPA